MDIRSVMFSARLAFDSASRARPVSIPSLPLGARPVLRHPEHTEISSLMSLSQITLVFSKALSFSPQLVLLPPMLSSFSNLVLSLPIKVLYVLYLFFPHYQSEPNSGSPCHVYGAFLEPDRETLGGSERCWCQVVRAGVAERLVVCVVSFAPNCANLSLRPEAFPFEFECCDDFVFSITTFAYTRVSGEQGF